jgi:hypothetical protein
VTLSTLQCAVCGKTGTVTNEWVRPGVASGLIMTGLDPENCAGCHNTLRSHGYAPMVIEPHGDGTASFRLIPLEPPSDSLSGS